MVKDFEDPVNALEAFSSILEALKVPYFVGGSVASSVRGQFRTTNDIDLICALKHKHLERFFSALEKDFLVDKIAVEAAIQTGRCFNIIHEPSFIKLDVFTKIEPFQESELERATLITLPNSKCKVRVASAEDIILSKLNWFKQGNETSTQQWTDIIAVIKVNAGKLDKSYLQRWAGELGVEALLVKALGDTK